MSEYRYKELLKESLKGSEVDNGTNTRKGEKPVDNTCSMG